MFDVSRFTKKFSDMESLEGQRKRLQNEKQKKIEKVQKFVQEYQYPYNHPIPEHVHKSIAKIEYVRSLRNYENETTPHWNSWVMGKDEAELLGKKIFPDASDPIYIIDKDLNIVGWEPTRNDARDWILLNKLWYKPLGRTTMYEYIKNRWLYKGQVYFVPVKEYEGFMKEKLKQNSNK